MALKDQEVIMTGMGKAIARLSEEFVTAATNKYLTAIDSVLADSEMENIEKFGTIKVIMDVGWQRITAVTHSDPNITINDLAAREAGKGFLTGDKGMDDVILESMGLVRKEEQK